MHILGYSQNKLGYRCLYPSTGCVFMSKHVIFYETCFPFHETSSVTSHASYLHNSTPIALGTSELIFPSPSPPNSVPIQPHNQPSPSTTSYIQSNIIHDSNSYISAPLSPPSPILPHPSPLSSPIALPNPIL